MRSIYINKFKSFIYEEKEALKVFERINGFVSELMLLGKSKSTNYEWRNIREILLYVVQLMESYAARYRVKFHMRVDGNLPVINGDDKQLKQVLLKME